MANIGWHILLLSNNLWANSDLLADLLATDTAQGGHSCHPCHLLPVPCGDMREEECLCLMLLCDWGPPKVLGTPLSLGLKPLWGAHPSPCSSPTNLRSGCCRNPAGHRGCAALPASYLLKGTKEQPSLGLWPGRHIAYQWEIVEG